MKRSFILVPLLLVAILITPNAFAAKKENSSKEPNKPAATLEFLQSLDGDANIGCSIDCGDGRGGYVIVTDEQACINACEGTCCDNDPSCYCYLT